MADRYTLLIDQGSAWSRQFTYVTSELVPISLVGYAARATLKASFGGSSLLSLTSSSGITLGGSAGTVTLAITPAQSSALTTYQGVWDLYLDPTGSSSPTSFRWLEGTWFLSRSVT